MEWKSIRRHELEEMMAKWSAADKVKAEPTNAFIDCRKRLIEIFNEIKEELHADTVKGNEYQVDLRFGMKLYVYFKENMQVTENQASNDSFWIFLSMKVIPDIVFWRWGPRASGRFFASSRRIWLKALWWYIHLSWQGDEASTFKILEKNTTDEVVQLVERSGSFGYRIKLCRAIMKQYGMHDPELRTRNNNLFRRAMKLNTARLAVMEPALYEGEEEGYVKDLFSRLVAGA